MEKLHEYTGFTQSGLKYICFSKFIFLDFHLLKKRWYYMEFYPGNNDPLSEYNPCMYCGACCAFYRASFYWAEANDVPGGIVPVELTEKLNNIRRVMKGTNQPEPRCIALEGTIGIQVNCAIYEKRPGICRDFKISYEDGSYHEGCDVARITWGLPPMEPPFINKPTKPRNFPRAA